MSALGAIPRVNLHTVYLRGDFRVYRLHSMYTFDDSHWCHVDGLLGTLTLAHQNLSGSGRGGKDIAPFPWKPLTASQLILTHCPNRSCSYQPVSSPGEFYAEGQVCSLFLKPALVLLRLKEK